MFGVKHTFESVVKTLIDGLENGSIVLSKKERLDQRFNVTFTVPIAIFSDKGAKVEDIERFLDFYLHGHIKDDVTADGRPCKKIEQQSFNGRLFEHGLEQLFKAINRFFQADQLGDYEGIGDPEIFVLGTGMGNMGDNGITAKAELVTETVEEVK